MQTFTSTSDDRKALAAKRLAELGIVDPTDHSSKTLAAALRLESLAGKRPGLLDNRKGNGDRLLDRIGHLLVDRYGTLEPYRTTKFIYARRASEEIIDDLVARCDFVVTAVGD
ncbi:hypothetical protein EPN44_06070 [bacterium]|nr:MAG: hypothetical protein EPN44_06070 [bacterium]